MRRSARWKRGWGGWGLLALGLSLAHFATFFDPERSIVSDVRFFLYFAWRIAEGAVPHLDLFDNKTFLASYAGALFYRLGSGLGADPLDAIRAGYLGLCAVGGWLVFLVFRRLGRGDPVAGFLGLSAYLTFGFIGALAAVGNVPKLLMALSGSAMGLLVQDRRWFLAGFAGAVAVMDWQIGALVWLAAFACALLQGRPRGRACLRVAAGGISGVAPFAAYYAMHGALGVTIKQTVFASLFRAATSFADQVRPDPITRITRQIAQSCPGHEWLFLVGLAGLAVLPVWMWRRRRADEWSLMLPLGLYHAGVVGFSALDFQRYGDFFLLLHSVAFFLGVLWVAAYSGGRDWLGRLGEARRGPRRLFGAAALVTAVLLSRPGPMRPEVPVFTPTVPVGVTLSDQKRVAAEVRERTRGKRFVVMAWSELLFLMRHENPLPLVYWNQASYGYYADVEKESFANAAARILLSADPDAFVYAPRTRIPAFPRKDFRVIPIGTKNGAYRVPLVVRREASP